MRFRRAGGYIEADGYLPVFIWYRETNLLLPAFAYAGQRKRTIDEAGLKANHSTAWLLANAAIVICPEQRQKKAIHVDAATSIIR